MAERLLAEMMVNDYCALWELLFEGNVRNDHGDFSPTVRVLSLEPISEERRRPERDLLAFEELRPAILGARLPLEDRASELRTRQ